MSNLQADSKNGFKECSRSDLEEYCEIFGVTVHPKHKDETLIEKLNTRVFALRDVIEVTKDAPIEEQDVVGNLPADDVEINPHQLLPTGTWGGRRRDVILHRDPRVKNQAPHMVKWDRSEIYIPFGDNPHSENGGYSIPWPHYEVLRNAKGDKISCEQKTEGGRTFIDKKREGFQAVPFNDMGTTPGTEHLPIGLKEYYQRKGEGWLRELDDRKLHSVYLILGYAVPNRPNWGYQDEREFLLEAFGFEQAIVA